MAVYTHITQEELTQHLTRFNIGRLVAFEGITEGVENSNYKVTTDQDTFILTLFEKRTRVEDLPFFIGFMEYLHGQGIPCPRILESLTGEKFLYLHDKPSVITNFLAGSWPRAIEDFHIAAVAQTLAQMHLAVKEFPLQRVNAMSLPAWKNLVAQCGEKTEKLGAGLALFFRHELEYLEKNWPQGLPAGAIHADLFPDNVFFKDEKLSGVIDFYFSCTDVFAYDLMLTLNAWCFSREGLPVAKRISSFLSAYQKLRPLSAQEYEALVFFGRAGAFRIAVTRLYDFLHPVPGADVKPKDPLEYVRILGHYQKEGAAP